MITDEKIKMAAKRSARLYYVEHDMAGALGVFEAEGLRSCDAAAFEAAYAEEVRLIQADAAEAVA